MPRTPPHRKPYKKETRDAAPAEIPLGDALPATGEARPWRTAAPLRLGGFGDRLDDGDGPLPRAIRDEGIGALVARPSRLRLELWRHRLCLHPAVVCLRPG